MSIVIIIHEDSAEITVGTLDKCNKKIYKAVLKTLKRNMWRYCYGREKKNNK